MKAKILRIILFILSLATASGAWSSLIEENSGVLNDWLWPFVWFSLFFICLTLFITINKKAIWALLLIFLSFLLSVIFIFSFLHLAIILIGSLIAWLGYFLIKKDFSLSLKINLTKSFKFGRAFLVLAIVLIIASQYFLKVERRGEGELVKSFEIQRIFGDNIYKNILGLFNPEIKNIKADATVDEALLEGYKKQLDESIEEQGISISSQQQNLLENFEQEKFLEAGRKQLSEATGEEITGQEKISQVMSKIVSNKLNEIISPKLFNGNKQILAGFLAILLFLTVWPLGSILAVFLIVLADGIFWIFKKSKLIDLATISVDKEIIK